MKLAFILFLVILAASSGYSVGKRTVVPALVFEFHSAPGVPPPEAPLIIGKPPAMKLEGCSIFPSGGSCTTWKIEQNPSGTGMVVGHCPEQNKTDLKPR